MKQPVISTEGKLEKPKENLVKKAEKYPANNTRFLAQRSK